jgi:hypothetical protein
MIGSWGSALTIALGLVYGYMLGWIGCTAPLRASFNGCASTETIEG